MIIAAELQYSTKLIHIIGVYCKENKKVELVSQIRQFIKRVEKVYNKPNIIVAGDMNTTTTWSIEEIEGELGLS